MTDISCYILRPFQFSRNGIKEESAPAGATVDIPEHLFDALNREGYLRRAVIGDGRITLEPPADEAAPTEGDESEDDVVIEPAPSPASATAELSEEEIAAIEDGSWKNWRYFSQRSLAAKISATPVNNKEDVVAAIDRWKAAR